MTANYTECPKGDRWIQTVTISVPDQPAFSWTGITARCQLRKSTDDSLVKTLTPTADLSIAGKATFVLELTGNETDDALPSQYRWNFGDFNSSNGTFAWIQTALFGASLGLHTINIYRADTNALVLTQASSSSTNGTFEYWNGSAWVTGLGSDAVNTRRRFVPTGSLPGGVDLYATLTVA